MRVTIRGLIRTPGFTAAVVLTLAVGIGATTAVFSVVDHVLLRPLRYEDPDRLFVVHEVIPRIAKTFPVVPVTGAHFNEWRRSAKSFEALALIEGDHFNLTGAGDPERVYAASASANLLPMLGVRPQLGRLFRPDEDEYGRDRVVILTDAFWRGQFSADPGVVGRAIVLNDERYEIVGVLPAGFHFPALSRLYGMEIVAGKPALWKPLGLHGDDLGPGNFNFICIGRLRDGVSSAEVAAELNGIQEVLAKQNPKGPAELSASLKPLHDQITGKARLGLQLVLGAVGIVLLIACVNISNLLLVRAAARRRENAVRTAIGASRARLIQSALLESLTLSMAGGLVAMAIAYATLRVLIVEAPPDLPRLDEVTLDLRIFLFLFGASVVAGLASGLIPAIHFAKADPQEAMNAVSRSVTGGRTAARLRSGLVSAEVALCVLGLFAGGLLLRSLTALMTVDRGFAADRVITVNFDLPSSRYSDRARRIGFVRSLLDQLQATPGVQAAGVVNRLPLSGQGGNSNLAAEGSTDRMPANIRQVNADYFTTMGIPIRAGRVFDERDRERRVAVISELAAKRLWPRQDPLGKRFRFGRDDAPFHEVIGIAGDVRTVSLTDDPSVTIYEPYWQQFYASGALAVKASGDLAAAVSAVRAAVRAIDPELPVQTFRTMEQIADESVAERRFQMWLVLLFGVIALLLASIGIYGVLSYAVTQRTNEIGVRMALGAPTGAIRALVMRQGLMPVGLGIGMGSLAAVWVADAFRGLLFGVAPRDVPTLAVIALVLCSVGFIAMLLPARRASRVDPIVALRYE